MEPLKNLLNINVITKCAELIKALHAYFDKEHFLSEFAHLESLELKERCFLISEKLDDYLPIDFDICKSIILKLLPSHNNEGISGWILWPIQMVFIRRIDEYQSKIKDIIYILKEITPYFSSEFSIRYLLKDYYSITHPILLSLIQDKNHHIRRWVSEGTRPRLPWGIKLDIFCKNPELNILILKSLQTDTSLYVRKSVANHLNDISKDNPQFVIDWVKKYTEEAQTNPLLFWTLKHGLRTLIKKGNIDALKFLGVSENIHYDNVEVTIDSLIIEKNDRSYQVITVKFDSYSENKTVIDFKLYYPGLKGEKTKIIKGKTFTSLIGKNQFTKKLNLFDNSVSTFNSGKYTLLITINGKEVTKVFWEIN